MKKIVTCSTLCAAMMVSGLTMADQYRSASGPYVGASMLFVDAGINDDPDASLMGIGGRLGSSFNENFSAEVRVAVGVGDDSVGEGWQKYDVELSSLIGGYLRASVPVGQNFHPYGVLGFTRSELKVSHPWLGKETDNDTDISYGIGADIDLDRNISLNIEYMNYYDGDDVEIAGFSIGIATKI